MQLISLRDVLEEMEKREQPFSIAFVTLDKRKNTGGKIIKLERAMQSGGSTSNNKVSAASTGQQNVYAKFPNHYKNRTRNLRIMNSNQIRKVRIRLIIFFNGKKVVY